MLKKIFLLYFTYYLALFPVLSFAIPLSLDGKTNTTLDKSRNGIPIVNIANPNNQGLSHNTFINYNVDSEGIILNNSKKN